MTINALSDAAANFSTPAYLFDLDELKSRIAYLRKHIGNNVSLCFAMKANPFIIEALCKNVERFEVCSPGEFRICEKADIPMKKLVISGVYKEEADVDRMLKSYSAIGIYTAESLEQFMLLNKYAGIYNRPIRVLLRLTSGNQFGIDETGIRKIIEQRSLYPYIKIVGIQFFSGTQKSSIKRLARELLDLDDFILSLSEDYGYQAEEMEFGPGLPVSYFQSEKNADEEHFLSEFSRLLSDLRFNGHIVLELGRSIAASCGFYLTKVVDMKTNKGQNYCIVDGGIHQICYYGQTMAMKVPYYQHLPSRDAIDPISWNVCGSLCTIHDILVKQLPLADLKKGDVLVFENTGAYSVMEGIALFLSRNLPTVYLYSQKNGFLCAREGHPTDTINSAQLSNIRNEEKEWTNY